jgi:predicted RNA binding protein YcfA (HicA-like mRNA interferase family)
MPEPFQGSIFCNNRVHGSHHIYVRPGREVRLSVPIHGNQSLKTGLLRHLLKQAGISEDEI